MSNFLVETKNEYTTHLINILSPLIFEGLQSIYKEAIQIAGTNDILKIFQSFLKRVPKWNQSIIDKETDRIINSSQSYGWLNDLIKATLKANLVVLMYNPTVKIQSKVDSVYYQDIKTSNFIHKLYIECARELWNNPYLLYHNYPPIEIKRNQRDCMSIIKDCIKEALRKLLPVKHILQVYLGEEMAMDNLDNNFEKAMSEAEEKNLTKMINKDLAGDNDKNNNYDNNKLHNLEIDYKASQTSEKPKNMNGGKLSTNSEEKTVRSRILNIINNNNSIKKSDTYSPTSDSSHRKSSKNNKSESDSEPIKTSEKSHHSVKSFDDKLKAILKKDLATDSEMETSLNYTPENNDKGYLDVFSNSNVVPKKATNESKDKNKFFGKFMTGF